MPPTWLTVVAWIWLGVGFASAAVLLFDILVRGHRQPMGVMEAVYPITALYFGPVALLLYWRWGRSAAGSGRMKRADSMHHATPMHGMGVTRARPPWATTATEVSHCGAGCVLGDVISEWAIYALAIAVAGQTLFAEYIGDYVLALSFGIVFQYFAIAPMRGLGLRDGLVAAAKADFISLTCFEIGLFGWMALMNLVFFPAPNQLMPNSAAFWFLMQVGMIVGFFTSWPANVWLLDRGIKVAM